MLSRTDLGQVYGSVNRDLLFDDMIGDEDSPHRPVADATATHDNNHSSATTPPHSYSIASPDPESPETPHHSFSIASPDPEYSDDPDVRSPIRNPSPDPESREVRSREGAPSHKREFKKRLLSESLIFDDDILLDEDEEARKGEQAEESPRMEISRTEGAKEAERPAAADSESEDEDVVVCGQCYKSFKSAEELQRHRHQQQPCLKLRTCSKCTPRRSFTCHYCPEVRQSPWNIILHVQLKHRVVLCQEIEAKRARLLAAKKAKKHIKKERVDAKGYTLPPTPSPSQLSEVKGEVSNAESQRKRLPSGQKTLKENPNIKSSSLSKTQLSTVKSQVTSQPSQTSSQLKSLGGKTYRDFTLTSRHSSNTKQSGATKRSVLGEKWTSARKFPRLSDGGANAMPGLPSFEIQIPSREERNYEVSNELRAIECYISKQFERGDNDDEAEAWEEVGDEEGTSDRAEGGNTIPLHTNLVRRVLTTEEHLKVNRQVYDFSPPSK